MNTFLCAFAVSFIFCIVKFIEMRFITKEAYPLKILCKESLFVLFSVIVGDFIIEEANSIKMIGGSDTQIIPEVFTTNPEF
jgi:hypothetical protein